MRQIVAAVAAVLAAQGAWADDREDVQKAARKTSELTNYSFRIELAFEGGPGGGGHPPATQARYDKDIGLYGKVGETAEFVKIADKVAFTDREGNWRRPPQGQSGGRGYGMMGLFLRNLKAPHEDVKGLDARFKKIEKQNNRENGCDVYAGELTEEAAREILPMRRILDRLQDAEISGEAKLWVNSDGILVRYEIRCVVKANFNGNDFEMTFTRTTELSDIGTTKVEIPDEAKKLLEEEKKDD